MPLPAEVLAEIKTRIDDSEAHIKDISDTIGDLRASGIDTSKQEERLTAVKEDFRKLRTFHDRQLARRG